MSRTERPNVILMMCSLIFILLFSTFDVKAQDKISDDSSAGKWLMETSQIFLGSKLIQSDNTTYDSCGNIVKFEHFTERQRITGESKHTYDANDYCIITSSSTTMSNSQGTVIDNSTTNFSFDNDGNLIRQETVNNSGIRHIVEFNKEGKILKQESISPDSGTISSGVWKYDSCGNTVKITSTVQQSSSVEEWTYEYGQNCLPVKATQISISHNDSTPEEYDMTIKKDIEYTYTKTGKVLKLIETTLPFNDISPEIRIIIENEYDENDNLIKSTNTKNYNYDDLIKSAKNDDLIKSQTEEPAVTINTYIWVPSLK